MTTIAGASRFINSATLANKNGTAPQAVNVLSDAGADILEAAKQNTGIGLSGRSRGLIKQFLSQTQSGFNSVFGLSTAKLSSNEIIQQEILALRSKIPQSQIASSLRGDTVDETV